jgi:hypothetical protein
MADKLPLLIDSIIYINFTYTKSQAILPPRFITAGRWQVAIGALSILFTGGTYHGTYYHHRS